MTIRPGEMWGEAVTVPDGLLNAATDAEAAALVGGDRPVRLTGGDLLTTLGGPSNGTGLWCFPIDVVRVVADGQELVAVAHVVARASGPFGWWRGPIVAAMNADQLGRWDVAPRAHPDDGRLDVVEVAAAMGLRARWHAWRRLPTGTHVPHPAIRVSRVAARGWQFERPQTLWVDGIDRGTVRSLDVTVEPDGAIVHT